MLSLLTDSLDWVYDLLEAHAGLATALTLGSFAVSGFAILMVPRLVAQWPEDYFLPDEEPDEAHEPHTSNESSEQGGKEKRFKTKLARLVSQPGFWLRQCFGLVLVLIGLALLILPGQGVLTILVGAVFLEFPRKTQVLIWVVDRAGLRSGLNKIRAKRRKGEFLWPDA